jgi:hypothetical protein
MKKALYIIVAFLCVASLVSNLIPASAEENIPTVREQLSEWGMLDNMVMHNDCGSDYTAGIIFPGLFKWELSRKSYFNLKTRKGIRVPIPVSSKLIMENLETDNRTSGSPTYRLVFDEKWLNSHQRLQVSEITKWLKKPNLVKVICHRYLLVNSGYYWRTIGVPLGVSHEGEIPLAE